jgi:hypothetical protein
MVPVQREFALISYVAIACTCVNSAASTVHTHAVCCDRMVTVPTEVAGTPAGSLTALEIS